MLKTILEILKFVAVIIGGISGLMGTLTETKDKSTAKITPAGKRIVVLIVLSSFVAVATQSVESYLKRQADEEDHERRVADEQRTLKILQGTQENLHKTDTIRSDLDTQRSSLEHTTKEVESRLGGLLERSFLRSMENEQASAIAALEVKNLFAWVDVPNPRGKNEGLNLREATVLKKLEHIQKLACRFTEPSRGPDILRQEEVLNICDHAEILLSSWLISKKLSQAVGYSQGVETIAFVLEFENFKILVDQQGKCEVPLDRIFDEVRGIPLSCATLTAYCSTAVEKLYPNWSGSRIFIIFPGTKLRNVNGGTVFGRDLRVPGARLLVCEGKNKQVERTKKYKQTFSDIDLDLKILSFDEGSGVKQNDFKPVLRQYGGWTEQGHDCSVIFFLW